MELQPPHPARFQLLEDSRSFCPSPLFLCHPGGASLSSRPPWIPRSFHTLRARGTFSSGTVRDSTFSCVTKPDPQRVPGPPACPARSRGHGQVKPRAAERAFPPARGPGGEEGPARRRRRRRSPGPRGALSSLAWRRKRPARPPPRGARRLISAPWGRRRSRGRAGREAAAAAWPGGPGAPASRLGACCRSCRCSAWPSACPGRRARTVSAGGEQARRGSGERRPGRRRARPGRSPVPGPGWRGAR